MMSYCIILLTEVIVFDDNDLEHHVTKIFFPYYYDRVDLRHIYYVTSLNDHLNHVNASLKYNVSEL